MQVSLLNVRIFASVIRISKALPLNHKKAQRKCLDSICVFRWGLNFYSCIVAEQNCCGRTSLQTLTSVSEAFCRSKRINLCVFSLQRSSHTTHGQLTVSSRPAHCQLTVSSLSAHGYEFAYIQCSRPLVNRSQFILLRTRSKT